MDENRALTPQEIADILKISKSTVYELIKRKELNSYRVGKKLRVDLSDVENYKNKTKEIQSNNIIRNSSDGNSALSQYSNTQYSNNAPFYEEPLNTKSFIICGQDVLLDILCRHLSCHPNGVRALRSYEGSYNSLYALYRGEVQVATAHMWDGKTGQYNITFVEKMLPGTSAIIIHLAFRTQGFYVINGNPKNINTWEDLKRSDITIINREKGSGTRILLDEHLRKLGISGRTIRGYSNESFSHLAVASTVARGGADVGIGNEKACLQVDGIDFIPLQKEQYDLIMKKEDLNNPAFQAIIDVIRSPQFKNEVQGLGGYDLSEMGKVVAET